MNKINLILLAVTMTIFWSCEPSKKKIAKDLEKEVMALHDQAMSKMGKIQKTVGALKKLKNTYMVDSLNHEHHLAKLEDCNKAIEDLQKADKAMMTWMHEYQENKPGEEVPPEERIAFYKKEKEKIKAVDESIEIGIHEGMHFVRRFYDDLADEQKKEESEKEESDDVEEDEEKADSSEVDADVQV